MKSVSTIDDIKYFDCENLEKLPALLQNILGVEFIRNNVEGLDIFGMKSLEAKKHEKKFHPLSSYWKDLLQAIDNGKKNKKLVLNEKTVFLIDLYFKLISAKDVLNLNDIINRIQVKGKFLSACFELDVVCYYLDLDMEVEVIPEGNTKTPDLLVSTKKGKVFVEAKLLSDTKKEEIPNWQLLVKQIDKILVKHKKSFVIHIEALERLKDVDFDEIKFLVEQYCIYGNNLNSYSTKNNCAIIHVYRLCDWEYRFIDKINLPEISELQEYMMNTQKTKKGQEYFNIRTIAITQFDRIDISKSVRRNLERAKKQLSEEFPYIVHVGLPITKSDLIYDVTNYIHDYMIGDIARNFKKINAIVVQSTSFDIKSKLGHPLQSHQTVIPNFSSITEFPSDFKFKCYDTINWTELPIKGEFKFTYISDGFLKDVSNGSCGEMFFVCSFNGKVQVSIMIIPKGRLLVQLVSPKFRRKKFELNINSIEFVNGSVIKINWDNNKAKMIINNNEIYSKCIM